MTPMEIMHLDHDQIPAYVESQAALGRDRASVFEEIAALRKDVILLSVAEDKNTLTKNQGCHQVFPGIEA